MQWFRYENVHQDILLPLKLIFPPSETNPKDADVKRTFISHEAMKHNGFNLLRAGKIWIFLVYGRYIRAHDEKVIHQWLKKNSKIPVFKKKQKKQTHTHKKKWSAIQNRCDYHLFIFFLFNSMLFFKFIELLS